MVKHESESTGVANLLSDGLTSACTNPETLAINRERWFTTLEMLQRISPLEQELLARRCGIGRKQQDLATMAKELKIPEIILKREEKHAIRALRVIAMEPSFRDAFSL